MRISGTKGNVSQPSGMHPIHRDLMIALSVGFAGAMGIVSVVVLIFG